MYRHRPGTSPLITAVIVVVAVADYAIFQVLL